MMPPGSPPASSPPRLGRYELITHIASGGMGSVVLARLAGAGGFQRLFAIKMLHRHLAQDPDFLEMLQDEARIAAQIRHPNVVGIQEIAESDEHGYYLVMDYVEGFPLSAILSQASRLAPRSRVRIAVRVLLDALAGLGAAHAALDDRGRPLNVVHRDFSPHNILVGVEGISRVSDFGIAKARARIAQTRAGEVRGKLAYMSPEQARGEELDARTDLFAAGIVLWECLTAQRLFKGYNHKETYGSVLFKTIASPREIVPELPDELCGIALSALERDREQRFQSARAMSQALERAARMHDLVGDAGEVGECVTTLFVAQLDELRKAIRSTAKDTWVPSRVSRPEPVGTDWDDAPNTTVDDPMDVAPTRAMNTDDAPPVLRDAIEVYRSSLSGSMQSPLAGALAVTQTEALVGEAPEPPRSLVRWITIVLAAVTLLALALALGIGVARWSSATHAATPVH